MIIFVKDTDPVHFKFCIIPYTKTNNGFAVKDYQRLVVKKIYFTGYILFLLNIANLLKFSYLRKYEENILILLVSIIGAK